MRGDSLRDFYAKTFAVVGLGLLAGAGALIDYWPAAGSVPEAPSRASLRLASPAVPTFTSEIPAPRPAVARAGRAVAPAPEPTVTLVADEPADIPVIDLTLSVVSNGGAPAEPLPEPMFDWHQADPRLAWLSTSIALDPAPLLDVSPDWRSFLGGAVRKTRESLRDARTGIRDVLAGFVGAVRRVSPFFNTTATGYVR